MNQKSAQLWGLVWAVLMLIYGILLVSYLHNSSKYVSKMSKRDQNFRQIALVVSWIQIAMSALASIGLIIALLSGDSSVYSPLSSLPPSAMGWM